MPVRPLQRLFDRLDSADKDHEISEEELKLAMDRAQLNFGWASLFMDTKKLAHRTIEKMEGRAYGSEESPGRDGRIEMSELVQAGLSLLADKGTSPEEAAAKALQLLEEADPLDRGVDHDRLVELLGARLPSTVPSAALPGIATLVLNLADGVVDGSADGRLSKSEGKALVEDLLSRLRTSRGNFSG